MSLINPVFIRSLCSLLYAFVPGLNDKENTVNDGMYNTVRVEPFIIGWGGGVMYHSKGIG